MIKFFRKIRQKMLTENKFSKYLLYAIGEIVLVVIGILIALSVNNFNKARIDRNEEVEILKALQLDFEETKKGVEETIELQQKVVSYCKKLKIILNEKTPSDSIGEYLFQGALSYWRIEPVNGTYDALIGSGKLGILRSEKLKRYLALYSSQIKYGFEDEKYSLDLTLSLTEIASENSAILLPAKYREHQGLKKTFTDEEYKKTVSELLKNRSFLGILFNKSAMEENRLEYQKSILRGVEIILDELGNELKSRNL